MEENQFKELSEKMDKIIRLLAVQSVGERKGVDAIKSLSAVGFQPMEIAGLIGTTANTVRVTLAGIRKKKGKKKSAQEN